jgi:hypothetical protein
MPRTGLAPIPLGTPIVARDGTITPFFRQRWQDVSDGWGQTASAQRVRLADQTGAIAATALLTVVTAGLYRVSWFLRTTRIDGGGSSVQVTLSFVDVDGVVLSYPGAALAGDVVTGWQGVVVPIRCGAPTDVTIAVAYASTTPGAMQYALEVSVEFLP